MYREFKDPSNSLQALISSAATHPSLDGPLRPRPSRLPSLRSGFRRQRKFCFWVCAPTLFGCSPRFFRANHHPSRTVFQNPEPPANNIMPAGNKKAQGKTDMSARRLASPFHVPTRASGSGHLVSLRPRKRALKSCYRGVMFFQKQPEVPDLTNQGVCSA